jgi:hypothetical protein
LLYLLEFLNFLCCLFSAGKAAKLSSFASFKKKGRNFLVEVFLVFKNEEFTCPVKVFCFEKGNEKQTKNSKDGRSFSLTRKEPGFFQKTPQIQKDEKLRT